MIKGAKTFTEARSGLDSFSDVGLGGANSGLEIKSAAYKLAIAEANVQPVP